MALPSSGPISLSQIRDEFGQSNPVSMSQYYRNGGVVPNAPQNSNIPTSGSISMDDFYGATNSVTATVSSSTTNLDVSSLFGSNWTTGIPKILVINSGVVIGSTGGSAQALNIPSNMGGSLTIINNGSIQGQGGAANGGNGGPAIRASARVSIDNNGTIYAGGGGGQRGGTGGVGTCSPSPGSPTPCSCRYVGRRCGGCGCCCGPGESGCRCEPTVGAPGCVEFYCRSGGCRNPPTGNPNVSGGTGGAGGRGQGYNQSSTGGSNGSQGPDCRGPSGRTGGRGGKGGDGGGWGAQGGAGDPGANGAPRAPGPSGLGKDPTGARGSAGFYIINDSNVTWIGGRGSVAGRVG